MDGGAGRARRLAALLCLGLAAAAFFAGVRELTLDFMDEGQILYPSWRTALGEWPYIAYAHLYGPSLFFLNGAALRVFGADLEVLRLVMVAVRGLTVVLAYAVARRLAPPLLALLAAGVLAVVWGTPIWLFNTPYAAFYATPACLAGLLVLLGPRTAGRALAAGLLFGLAMTFKQTQGAFAFLSAALWIVSERGSEAHARSPADGGASAGWAMLLLLVRAARIAGLAAIAGIVLAYTRAHLDSASTLWIMLPMALAIATIVARELRSPPAAAAAWASVRRMAGMIAGLAAPLLAYAALYASRGALGALVSNTLVTWPARIVWFGPLPGLSWAQVVLGGVALLSFAVVWVWARRLATAPLWLRLVPMVLLAAVAAAAHPLWLRCFGQIGVYGLAAWLPYVLLAAAAWTLWRGGDPAREGPRSLFCLSSASAILQLYPSADLPHALLTLPLHVPLLADAYGRFATGVGAARLRRTGAVALIAAWTIAIAAPVLSWRASLRAISGPVPFRQARHLRLTGLRIREAAALAARLRPQLDGGRDLLVLSDEQTLYFLMGARSALQEHEFLLFLIGGGFVDPAHPVLPGEEDHMLERLETMRPLVVDYHGSPATTRLAAALPRLMARIAACPQVAEVGRYRVRSCGE